MIKVKSIELGFSESNQIPFGKTFGSFRAVNSFLNGIKRPELGYYKTDFTVTFEDGEVYTGRYDIGSDLSTLDGHIKSFLAYVSCRERPTHFKDAHWAHHCAETEKNGHKSWAEKMLDNYDLTDAQDMVNC